MLQVRCDIGQGWYDLLSMRCMEHPVALQVEGF